MIKIFKYTATLFLAYSLLILSGQAFAFEAFVGTWMPTESALPQIKITDNQGLLRISAEGSFIGIQKKGIISQQAANQPKMALSVRFTLSDGDAIVHIHNTGVMLEAQWELLNGSKQKKFASTTYTRQVSRTRSAIATGAIKGWVVGEAKSTAGIFQISLYGPNDHRQFVRTLPLGRSKSFNFESLPDGDYWIFVESRGHTAIQAFPSQKKIVVKNGQIVVQNVELR
ncbi:MAG: hypothetical protein AAFQ92_29915 [Bacteroidota bacterium]